MTIRALFPTLIYTARLTHGSQRSLQARLLQECRQLVHDDAAGRRWSAKNYPGGYTSYGSVSRLQTLSPTFATLERQLDRHVRRYVRSLEYDLAGRTLSMTDCWVNVMPRGVVHSLHLHPLSTLSGTYYVRVPHGGPGIKLEDPRLDRYMAAPPRRADAPVELRPWITVPARTGDVVLFESWLRHEVTPNHSPHDRISISFNYSWF